MAAVSSSRSQATVIDDRHDDLRPQKEKLGHRRIDDQGEVSYKKVPTNALMSAIQLGIANSIGSLASISKRDILLQDFEVVQAVNFPASGSQTTPSHLYGDFRFRTYAPIAFRYFREMFHIEPADFLNSISSAPLKELSNPGASGSIFYVSHDDQFIIKTVQHKEAEFLQKLLPGYYMNLQQNPRTLLPKFFGFFCYQSLGKNIRLVVMNNLLPQALEMHEKYDLKGSLYKRHASASEREKSHPTLKDLNFLESNPTGLQIDASVFDALIRTITRDCLVLQAFKIMDYSLLVGVHNLEEAGRSRSRSQPPPISRGGSEVDDAPPGSSTQPSSSRKAQLRSKFSIWENDGEGEGEPLPAGAIPARNANGDRLLLFLGIIDILQNYRLLKKFEHAWKSVLHDGDSISVHNPQFYANRFLRFVQEKLFQRVQPDRKGASTKFRSFVHSYIALKSSPSRRKARRSIGEEEKERDREREREGDRDREPLAPVSARDVVPIIRSGNRRSYQQRSESESAQSRGEKKVVGRLFATAREREDEADELVTLQLTERLQSTSCDSS